MDFKAVKRSNNHKNNNDRKFSDKLAFITLDNFLWGLFFDIRVPSFVLDSFFLRFPVRNNISVQ